MKLQIVSLLIFLMVFMPHIISKVTPIGAPSTFRVNIIDISELATSNYHIHNFVMPFIINFFYCLFRKNLLINKFHDIIGSLENFVNPDELDLENEGSATDPNFRKYDYRDGIVPAKYNIGEDIWPDINNSTENSI